MYGTESFHFWWLFPVLMIFFCLFMCLSRRRGGTVGCCMGWFRPRDLSPDRRADDGDDSHRMTKTSAPMAEKSQAEGLKSTVESLEHRLRALEEETKGNKLKKEPPFNGS